MKFFPLNFRQRIQTIPPLNNGINNMNNNQCWDQEFATRQLETKVMKTRFSPSIQQSFQMTTFPHTGKPEKKKSQFPSAIPNLKRSLLDKILPEGNNILKSEENPPKKRKSNKNTIADGEKDLGGSLFLTFAPGSTLPTNETLISIFSRFGLLKESEMQVLNHWSVQIVYERSSEARFAYRSLEKGNPFGESLVSSNLHCKPDAASRVIERNNKMQILQAVVPVNASQNVTIKQWRDIQPVDVSKNAPAKHGETRDIGFIRKNVGIMKLTLSKAGDNLESEMRAKLENELNVFLDKISTMDGGTSSFSA